MSVVRSTRRSTKKPEETVGSFETAITATTTTSKPTRSKLTPAAPATKATVSKVPAKKLVPIVLKSSQPTRAKSVTVKNIADADTANSEEDSSGSDTGGAIGRSAVVKESSNAFLSTPIPSSIPTAAKPPETTSAPTLAPAAQTSEELFKEPYGDFHKIVLQGIYAAGYLDAGRLKKLFVGACTYLRYPPASIFNRIQSSYIQHVVKGINDRLKAFNMAIRSDSCELSGKRYYIFLMCLENPMMILQTRFSPFEIELFHKCMEGILRKYNNFSMPLGECIAMGKEIQDSKESTKAAEEFIETMVEMYYFVKFVSLSGRTNLTLGMRTMRDFEPVLRETYPDVITKCTLCNMVMLHGYLCPHCRLVVHRYCYSRYLSKSIVCPSCACSWKKAESMIPRMRDGTTEDFGQDFVATLCNDAPDEPRLAGEPSGISRPPGPKPTVPNPAPPSPASHLADTDGEVSSNNGENDEDGNETEVEAVEMRILEPMDRLSVSGLAASSKGTKVKGKKVPIRGKKRAKRLPSSDVD